MSIRKFTPDSPANYSQIIRKFTSELFGNLFAISPPNPLIPPPPPSNKTTGNHFKTHIRFYHSFLNF